jgi:hypothetical protein
MSEGTSDNTPIIADQLVAARITIEPNSMEKVALGRYREADPEPKFRIYYGPHEPHVVTHHKSKISDGTIYILFIQFQNFGEKTCSITIKRNEPDRRITNS